MSKSKKNTEEEVKDQQETVENQEANQEVKPDAEQPAEEKKEATMEEKYNEVNDKYLRLYAEFENFRRRTNKEKLDTIISANAGVMKELLPVLDDFERAIANNQKTEDVAALKEGFQLIFNKFSNILTAKGLKPMEVNEAPFDSEIHEAIANIPAPDEKLKGKVVDTVEKGYYLNEKVIRYAKVVVGQ